MKKTAIILALLAQSLMITAQQVETDTSRGVAYVSATSASAVSATSAQALSPAMPPRKTLAATERGVGYSQGDSITISGARIGTAGSYDMAAMLTSSVLTNYKGCKIVGVRFAVSESIGKSNIFIYKVDSQGNAEEVVRNTVRRTSEGWNDVRLNSAQEIEISGDEQFIMGFTYNESDEMVSAKKGALCFYGDKVSSSYSTLILQDETFNSITNISDLCVQLIVDVSSLPKKAVSLSNILNGTSYKQIGSTMDIMMSYANVGLETVNSARVGFRIDDGEATYVDLDKTTSSDFANGLQPGASATLQLQLPIPSTTAVGRHNLNVFVDKIDGEAPVATEKGTLADPFVAYNEAFQRQQSYIEQYNSQESYMATYVNSYYSKVDRDDDACVVNIYQKGEPLAVEQSLYLNDLYAYTLPCSTSNRFYYGMGEAHYAFDLNDYVTVMPELTYDGIRLFINEAKTFPSFATVNVKADYDSATRTATIAVDGDIATEAHDIFGDMALTVMLAEDNVKGKQTVVNSFTGTTSTNNNYTHDQVLRTYVSDPLGDTFSSDAATYSKNYTYAIPADWKPADIKVVAFVTKAFDEVTAANMQMADVTNCNSVKLASSTGIDNTAFDEADAKADGFYTLDGTKIIASQMRHGIYVVRQNGKSLKVVR